MTEPMRKTILESVHKINNQISFYIIENSAVEELKANGKTGKQGLIAVCNKLLKQVFAVVKNNSLYQPNYCSAKQ